MQLAHTRSSPAPRKARIAERAELGIRLGEIGLHRRAPVLVLVGGADGMDADTIARLEPLFTRTIAPLAEALDACVVDGGTDTGVMGMMGRARAAIGAAFPLVGVVPVDALHAAVAAGRPARIEPNHSHVVLVPGAHWDDAGPWLGWVAEELAGGMPCVTLLVNGGDLTWDDALHSVQDGRPVIAVAGSGGVADALAAALAGEEPDLRARELLSSGLVEAAGFADGPTALGRRLAGHLGATAVTAPAEQRHPAHAHQDLEELIEGLKLTPLQKHFLRSRWLDQVTWASRKARQAQQRYYALRLVVIVGSIAIPTLLGLSDHDATLRTLAIIAGMAVALSAAIEEFFHYGERWRHYRQTVEQLKAEGWRFFQRTGPYQHFRSHGAAYGEFAGAVERLLAEDVKVYLEEIVREQRQAQNTGQASGASPLATQAGAVTAGTQDGRSSARP